jgi:hypothetical protein
VSRPALGLFPWSKVMGTSSRPLTSVQCRGQEWCSYNSTFTCIHGVMLKPMDKFAFYFFIQHSLFAGLLITSGQMPRYYLNQATVSSRFCPFHQSSYHLRQCSLDYCQPELHGFFYDAVSNSENIAPNVTVIGEKRFGNDGDYSRLYLFEITCMSWGKPLKASLMIDGRRAEIWTLHLPNEMQENYPFG